MKSKFLRSLPSLLLLAILCLFSCQKETMLPDGLTDPNLAASSRACSDCVESWEDSRVTYTLSTNLFVDVWNDATKTYYHVYRTGGAIWGNIRYQTGCISANLSGMNLCTDCSSYDFSVDNPAGWSACTEVTVTLRVGGLGGGGGNYQGCTTYALRELCPQEEVCYEEESAWSAGQAYNEDKGNWATFTPYSGTAGTVALYAGQTLDAGTVHFSAPIAGNVTITIALNPGYAFQDVAENVKIQGYAVAPSGNPAPGQFQNKGTATGSPYSMTVPSANFYGVHVDVNVEVPCPE
jgi:hypothetical protein